MHITREGNLELFVIGVEKPPRRWVRDTRWSGLRQLFHTISSSVWRPTAAAAAAPGPAGGPKGGTKSDSARYRLDESDRGLFASALPSSRHLLHKQRKASAVTGATQVAVPSYDWDGMCCIGLVQNLM